MNREEAKERILGTALLGPALKSQLAEQFDYMDDVRLEWVLILIDRAESAFARFGEASADYRNLLSEIESAALRAAHSEADEILAELQKELCDL